MTNISSSKGGVSSVRQSICRLFLSLTNSVNCEQNLLAAVPGPKSRSEFGETLYRTNFELETIHKKSTMFDDDDDEIEIIDTVNETLESSNRVSADDLKLLLRKEEKRIKEIFPHANSIHQLDDNEVFTAKRIIDQEKAADSDFKASLVRYQLAYNKPISGQKRANETPEQLTLPNKVQRNNLIEKASIANQLKPSLPPKKYPLLDKKPPIVSSSSSRTIWNGRENMKFVNGSLINVETLLSNAPKSAHSVQLVNSSGTGVQTVPPSSQVATNKNSATTNRLKESEKKLLNEIDFLLSQKSSHLHEANDEWHENFQNRLKSLEKQEYKEQKKAERTHFMITGFECLTCSQQQQQKSSFLTELYPSVCQEKKHIIRSNVSIMKRFFLCSNCGRKDFTLLKHEVKPTPGSNNSNINNATGFLCLPPSRNCGGCGKDAWVMAGKTATFQGSEQRGGGGHSLDGEKLVTSATDWTSRQDKLNMAVRVSSLDNKR
jgi:protein-tyrosine-phosphatase